MLINELDFFNKHARHSTRDSQDLVNMSVNYSHIFMKLIFIIMLHVLLPIIIYLIARVAGTLSPFYDAGIHATGYIPTNKIFLLEKWADWRCKHLPYYFPIVHYMYIPCYIKNYLDFFLSKFLVFYADHTSGGINEVSCFAPLYDHVAI